MTKHKNKKGQQNQVPDGKSGSHPSKTTHEESITDSKLAEHQMGDDSSDLALETIANMDLTPSNPKVVKQKCPNPSDTSAVEKKIEDDTGVVKNQPSEGGTKSSWADISEEDETPINLQKRRLEMGLEKSKSKSSVKQLKSPTKRKMEEATQFRKNLLELGKIFWDAASNHRKVNFLKFIPDATDILLSHGIAYPDELLGANASQMEGKGDHERMQLIKHKVIELGQEFWDSITKQEKIDFINHIEDAKEVLFSFNIKDDTLFKFETNDCNETLFAWLVEPYTGNSFVVPGLAANLKKLGNLHKQAVNINVDNRGAHNLLEGSPSWAVSELDQSARVNVHSGDTSHGQNDGSKLGAVGKNGGDNHAGQQDLMLQSSKSQPTAPMAPWISHFKNNRQPAPELQLKRIEVEDDFQLEAKDERDVVKSFGHCLIGYVAGRFPGLKALATTCDKWGVKYTLHPHISGWTVFKFVNEDDLVSVLEGGPYNIFGMPLILKRLPRGFAFGNIEITKVPVWINLPSLPLECWTHETLSKIASRIGEPLAMDRLTSTLERISYARLFVEVDAAKDLVEEVRFRLSDGTPIVQHVHYEFRPRFCVKCRSVGHFEDKCKHDDTFITQKLSRRRGISRARNQNPIDKNATQSEDNRAAQMGGAAADTSGTANTAKKDGNKAVNLAGTMAKPDGNLGTRKGSNNGPKRVHSGADIEAKNARNTGVQAASRTTAQRNATKMQYQENVKDKNVVTCNSFELLEDNVPSHFEQCINVAIEKKNRNRNGASTSRPK